MMGAAAAGALIVGIPLAGVLCYERQGVERVEETLDHYEQLQEQYSYADIFVMARDAVAGEELTADMIKKQRVQSTEDLSGTQSPESEELIGRRLKVSLRKGAMLGTDIVYEGVPIANDERRVELNELCLPQTLKEDEFVDVRIVFPNGEDYLVVGHKRVYRLIRDEEEAVLALELRLLEEELLRYQAACVDTRTYRDTRLYAVQYTEESQPAAQAYYPVNRAVFQLLQWNPNIVELFTVESEQEKRELLEAHLESFLLEEPEEAGTLSYTGDGSQPSEELQLPDQITEPLTLYTGLPEES